MKTLRMIGMGIMTVLMCVGGTSCSSDDSNGIDNPNPSINKRVSEWTVEDSRDSPTASIKYDDKGRMIEYKETYKDQVFQQNFSYSDSKIEITAQSYYNGKLTGSNTEYLLLENGRIVEWDGHKCYYNNDGHLVKIQGRVDITWEGDNIVKVDDTKVTPSDIDFMKSEPESFPSEFLMEEEFFWRTGTMLGKRPAKSSLYSPWGTELIRESDMNGYVTKCSCNMWTKTVIWK